MRIACLHTAESNVAVFDAALAGLDRPDVELTHIVRADLLASAEAAGGLMPEIVEETRAALGSLEADFRLLTCSTLGPSVDGLEGVARVDAALAREAVRCGGKIAVLYAVETTRETTRLLFEDVSKGTDAEIEMRLVAGAWDLFKSGDRASYFAVIAKAADKAADAGYRVALAQASMAGAASLTQARPLPLSSPAAGLREAVQAACE